MVYKYYFTFREQGGGTKVTGRDDAKDFVNIKSAMEVLNFSEDDRWSVFKLLAALLHLGNIKYKGEQVIYQCQYIHKNGAIRST